LGEGRGERGERSEEGRREKGEERLESEERREEREERFARLMAEREDRLLAGLKRIEGKVDVVEGRIARLEPRAEVPITEEEAKRVFMLMKSLEGGRKQHKAPLPVVFRLTVLEGRSQAWVARDCECVPALISRRVKVIESRFGMPLERLRNFASVLAEMERSVKGDGCRTRKRGAPRDEAAEDDESPEGADLVEDGGGYLPEEKEEEGG
jgi:hypothetical protein